MAEAAFAEASSGASLDKPLINNCPLHWVLPFEGASPHFCGPDASRSIKLLSDPGMSLGHSHLQFTLQLGLPWFPTGHIRSSQEVLSVKERH